MKKRILKISIIIICILLTIGILRAAFLYIGNMIPNKDYFGDNYKEIIYPTWISDYFIANNVVKEADKAMSTITTPKKAEKQFDKLSYLCVTDEEAVKENHNINFITAYFSDNTGYMWLKYSSEAYDKNGEVTYSSQDILTRWELIKQDGNWKVFSIKEHP